MAERNREYELLMALSPVASESEATDLVDTILGYVTEAGGSLVERENIGVKRLSFPVNDYREGNYVRAVLNMAASEVRGFERTLNANEEILVHMVSRI
ncbi:MAG: 30S ribosomal protein S6 [Dehalococcoidia bacterium]|nr:30S ribosomal protein S6 [Chloroflexota bacterium]MBR96895.1 30S ribosomal protein S6 [Dehalococcoidia bacterium]